MTLSLYSDAAKTSSSTSSSVTFQVGSSTPELSPVNNGCLAAVAGAGTGAGAGASASDVSSTSVMPSSASTPLLFG